MTASGGASGLRISLRARPYRNVGRADAQALPNERARLSCPCFAHCAGRAQISSTVRLSVSDQPETCSYRATV